MKSASTNSAASGSDAADTEERSLRVLQGLSRAEISKAILAFQSDLRKNQPDRRLQVFQYLYALVGSNPNWSCQDSKSILLDLPKPQTEGLSGAIESRTDVALRLKCADLVDVHQFILKALDAKTGIAAAAAILRTLIEAKLPAKPSDLKLILQKKIGSPNVQILALEWIRLQPEKADNETIKILIAATTMKPFDLQTRAFEAASALSPELKLRFSKQLGRPCRSYSLEETQRACSVVQPLAPSGQAVKK